MGCIGRELVRALRHCPHAQPIGGFYRYYRLDTAHGEDDADADGARGEGELTTAVDGLHSPFGVIGKLRLERKLSLKEVLWGDPWMLLILEQSDQPRTRTTREGEELPTIDNF